MLYLLALPHTEAARESAELVATVDPKLVNTTTGASHVADVFFDAEQDKLWAVCDDECDGKTALLTLQDKKFVVEHVYNRPKNMPNINNEGFAIAPGLAARPASRSLSGPMTVRRRPRAALGYLPVCRSHGPEGRQRPGFSQQAIYGYGSVAAARHRVTGDGARSVGDRDGDEGCDLLGSVDLSNDGSPTTLEFNTALLGAGTHELTATYSGDSLYQPSDATYSVTVDKAIPTVQSADSTVAFGQEASIPVLVTVPGGTPTGTVTLRLGNAPPLASAKLSGGGAVVKLPAGSLAVGTHSLSVAYSGDANVEPGSATTSLIVTAPTATATTTTTPGSVTATGGSVVYGQSATVPVTVTASGATPTGAVTVLAGGTPLGMATLAAGAATVTIPAKSLAPGAHQLTVLYSGDAQVTAASSTVGLTVTRAAASVEKPTVKPKRVVVKKTKARVLVKVVAAGLTPSGKVTITGRGVKTKTATLRADGTVVVKLAKFKKRGVRTLTVTYSGDTYVEAATTTLKVRVKKPKKR